MGGPERVTPLHGAQDSRSGHKLRTTSRSPSVARNTKGAKHVPHPGDAGDADRRSPVGGLYEPGVYVNCVGAVAVPPGVMTVTVTGPAGPGGQVAVISAAETTTKVAG